MDPYLTNEYYKNFNEFEDDSSPERIKPTSSYTSMNTRNSMSKTVVPANKRRIATAKQPPMIRKQHNEFVDSKRTAHFSGSKTISSNQPRASVSSRNEYEQLINALNTKSNCKKNFINLTIVLYSLI